jgi:hypothetical protein
LGSSFGAGFVKGELSGSRTGTSSQQEHRVVASMRIERYYSSIEENKATLHKDVTKLLDDRDYVGFFKSCGPTYVRSIRRAQEVTAMFTFKTSDKSTATEMKAAIESAIYGSAEGKMKSSVKKTMSSLQIKIVGFGLGLDDKGSDTLVATVSLSFNKHTVPLKENRQYSNLFHFFIGPCCV